MAFLVDETLNVTLPDTSKQVTEWVSYTMDHIEVPRNAVSAILEVTAVLPADSGERMDAQFLVRGGPTGHIYKLTGGYSKSANGIILCATGFVPLRDAGLVNERMTKAFDYKITPNPFDNGISVRVIGVVSACLEASE